MSLINSPTNEPVDRQDPKSGQLVAISDGYRNFFNAVFNILTGLTSSGTTAQRPTATRLLWPGYMYFDTTLGKPIWVKTVKPLVFVDATGAPV